MKRNKPSLAKLRSDIERIELPGESMAGDNGHHKKKSAGINRGEQKDFELLDLKFDIPDLDFTIPDLNFELPEINFNLLEEVTMVTLNTKEIAKAIGCNILTVRRNIHAGKLRAIKKGKAYRVTEKDLKDWIDNRYRLRNKVS